MRVDPKTFRLEILKYVVVHDCGQVINPLVVEGQIEGGVAQGIGGAFYERLAYDSDGQLRNASFMEFLMPYATEIPPIEIDHIETPSPLNPLGVKGAGEAGVIPVGAVIAFRHRGRARHPDHRDAAVTAEALRALDLGLDLDLHQVAIADQAADVNDRVRRRDAAEQLNMRPGSSFPVGVRRQHQPRAHDVMFGPAELRDRGQRLLQCLESPARTCRQRRQLRSCR